MAQVRDQMQITEGMEVVSSDGDKVGKVSEVFASHFMVKEGFFFPKDYYIPTSAVASADDRRAYLNVTKEEAVNQDPSWEQQPDYMATTGSGDMNRDPEPFTHDQDTQRTHVNEEDDLRMDVHEEELTASRRELDRGAVTIDKDVIEEERSIDVPLTEERVEVTRRAVDRDATAGDGAFEEGTVEVPVRGQEVDIEKQARVVEEIDIDKTAEQHTERVSDTVRREEVTVDGTPVDTSTGNERKRKNKNARR